MEAAKILQYDKPVDADKKLIDTFGISLYWFAMSLARILSGPHFYDPRRMDVSGVSYYEFCRAKIIKLRRLKERILKTLYELETPESNPFTRVSHPIIMLSNLDNKFPGKNMEDDFFKPTDRSNRNQINREIEDTYKIKVFIESIDKKISRIASFLHHHPAKGNPIKLRNIAIADWIRRLEIEYGRAGAMSSKTPEMLISLIRWFYGNLAPAIYGEWLKEKEDRKRVSIRDDGTTREVNEFGFDIEKSLVQKHIKKYPGGPFARVQRKFIKDNLYEDSKVFDIQTGAIPYPRKGKNRLIEEPSFRIDFGQRVILFRLAAAEGTLPWKAPWLRFPNDQTLSMREILNNYVQIPEKATEGRGSWARVMLRAFETINATFITKKKK